MLDSRLRYYGSVVRGERPPADTVGGMGFHDFGVGAQISK